MLEAGVPRFPRDFPTTEPYREHAKTWEASGRWQWERRPPAKRVNHKLLEIDNPWRADWGHVLGRCTPGLVGHVPTQRDVIHPWLLSKYLASAVLDGTAGVSDPASWLFGKLNALRLIRGNTGLGPETGVNDLWCHALVQVRVELHGRGTLGDLAVIYPLRDDELRIHGHSSEDFRQVRFACRLAEAILKMSAVPRTSAFSARYNHGLHHVGSLLAFEGTALRYRHSRLV